MDNVTRSAKNSEIRDEAEYYKMGAKIKFGLHKDNWETFVGQMEMFFRSKRHS